MEFCRFNAVFMNTVPNRIIFTDPLNGLIIDDVLSLMVIDMTERPFDEVKETEGPCGIWCGACLGGNGALIELTGLYAKVLEESKFALDEFAPERFEFDTLMKQLSILGTMSSCPGCGKGGGIPDCGIRDCTQREEDENCSSCEQLDGCDRYEVLGEYSSEVKKALVENIDVDPEVLKETRECEMKEKWPQCILVCNNTRH